MQQMPYPVRFSVDYPDRSLDWLTSAFRIFTVIPIAIVLGTVSGGNGWDWDWNNSSSTRTVAVGAGGLLFFGPLLMILFRQKYPRWWFDWNLELQRFGNRWAPTWPCWTTATRPPTSTSRSISTTPTRTSSAT